MHKKLHMSKFKERQGFISMFNFSENTYLRIFLIVVLGIGAIVFAGIIWLLYNNYMFHMFIAFVVYIIILKLAYILNKKYPCKAFDVVISVPIILINLSKPFVTIMGSYLFVVLFAFGIPAIVLKGLCYLGVLSLKHETIIFLVFVMASILCSYNYVATKWIIHQSPFCNKGNHRYEEYIEQLAIYSVHPNNVIFILYFAYFVFLGLSGFQLVENDSFIISEALDNAILKAFLVFIAFTNMRSKAKDAQLDTKNLFQQTLKLLIT